MNNTFPEDEKYRWLFVYLSLTEQQREEFHNSISKKYNFNNKNNNTNGSNNSNTDYEVKLRKLQKKLNASKRRLPTYSESNELLQYSNYDRFLTKNNISDVLIKLRERFSNQSIRPVWVKFGISMRVIIRLRLSDKKPYSDNNSNKNKNTNTNSSTTTSTSTGTSGNDNNEYNGNRDSNSSSTGYASTTTRNNTDKENDIENRNETKDVKTQWLNKLKNSQPVEVGVALRDGGINDCYKYTSELIQYFFYNTVGSNTTSNDTNNNNNTNGNTSSNSNEQEKDEVDYTSDSSCSSTISCTSSNSSNKSNINDDRNLNNTNVKDVNKKENKDNKNKKKIKNKENNKNGSENKIEVEIEHEHEIDNDNENKSKIEIKTVHDFKCGNESERELKTEGEFKTVSVSENESKNENENEIKSKNDNQILNEEKEKQEQKQKINLYNFEMKIDLENIDDIKYFKSDDKICISNIFRFIKLVNILKNVLNQNYIICRSKIFDLDGLYNSLTNYNNSMNEFISQCPQEPKIDLEIIKKEFGLGKKYKNMRKLNNDSTTFSNSTNNNKDLPKKNIITTVDDNKKMENYEIERGWNLERLRDCIVREPPLLPFYTFRNKSSGNDNNTNGNSNSSSTDKTSTTIKSTKQEKEEDDYRDYNEIESGSKYDVVIVGAGIGGLGAAKLLLENGVNCIVIEARNRIGGRMFTTYFNNTDSRSTEDTHQSFTNTTTSTCNSNRGSNSSSTDKTSTITLGNDDKIYVDMGPNYLHCNNIFLNDDINNSVGLRDSKTSEKKSDEINKPLLFNPHKDIRNRRNYSKSILGLTSYLKPLVGDISGYSNWEPTLYNNWYDESHGTKIDLLSVIKVNFILEQLLIKGSQLYYNKLLNNHKFFTVYKYIPITSTSTGTSDNNDNEDNNSIKGEVSNSSSTDKTSTTTQSTKQEKEEDVDNSNTSSNKKVVMKRPKVRRKKMWTRRKQRKKENEEENEDIVDVEMEETDNTSNTSTTSTTSSIIDTTTITSNNTSNESNNLYQNVKRNPLRSTRYSFNSNYKVTLDKESDITTTSTSTGTSDYNTTTSTTNTSDKTVNIESPEINTEKNLKWYINNTCLNPDRDNKIYSLFDIYYTIFLRTLRYNKRYAMTDTDSNKDTNTTTDKDNDSNRDSNSSSTDKTSTTNKKINNNNGLINVYDLSYTEKKLLFVILQSRLGYNSDLRETCISMAKMHYSNTLTTNSRRTNNTSNDSTTTTTSSTSNKNSEYYRSSTSNSNLIKNWYIDNNTVDSIKSNFKLLTKLNVYNFDGKSDSDKLIIEGWGWLLKHLLDNKKRFIYLNTILISLHITDVSVKSTEMTNKTNSVHTKSFSSERNADEYPIRLTLNCSNTTTTTGSNRIVSNSSSTDKASTTNDSSELGNGKVKDLYCKYVLITVPNSVIENIEFDPPLDVNKRNSLKNYNMGYHNKIIMQFRESDIFWPKDELQFNCLDNKFQFVNLHPYGKTGCILIHSFPPYSKLFDSTLYNDITRDSNSSSTNKTSTTTDSTTNTNSTGNISSDFLSSFNILNKNIKKKDTVDNNIDILLNCLVVLHKMFRPPRKVYPVSVYMTNWLNDIYSKGSYSYPRASARDEDIIHLKSPHPTSNPRVLFSGEYISNSYYQCVDGSYDTSIRAAEDILNIGLLNKDLSSTNKTSTTTDYIREENNNYKNKSSYNYNINNYLNNILSNKCSDDFIGLPIPLPNEKLLGYYLTDGSDELFSDDSDFINISSSSSDTSDDELDDGLDFLESDHTFSDQDNGSSTTTSTSTGSSDNNSIEDNRVVSNSSSTDKASTTSNNILTGCLELETNAKFVNDILTTKRNKNRNVKRKKVLDDNYMKITQLPNNTSDFVDNITTINTYGNTSSNNSNKNNNLHDMTVITQDNYLDMKELELLSIVKNLFNKDYLNINNTLNEYNRFKHILSYLSTNNHTNKYTYYSNVIMKSLLMTIYNYSIKNMDNDIYLNNNLYSDNTHLYNSNSSSTDKTSTTTSKSNTHNYLNNNYKNKSNVNINNIDNSKKYELNISNIIQYLSNTTSDTTSSTNSPLSNTSPKNNRILKDIHFRTQGFSNNMVNYISILLNLNHDFLCYYCLRGGEVILCDSKDCTRVWHYDCLPPSFQPQSGPRVPEVYTETCPPRDKNTSGGSNRNSSSTNKTSTTSDNNTNSVNSNGLKRKLKLENEVKEEENNWKCPICCGYPIEKGENSCNLDVQLYWIRRGYWWRVKAVLSISLQIYKRIYSLNNQKLS